MWRTIDVVWWSHALKESRLLSTEKLSIYSLPSLSFPAQSILLHVPEQGIKLTHQPWSGADPQHSFTAQELHLVPSTTPQWGALMASKSSWTRQHPKPWMSEWRINTAQQPQEIKKPLHSYIFPFPEFFSSNLQHHLNQIFIIYYNSYCIL